MRFLVSKQDIFSTMFVLIASAAALLTTTATKASAKVLKVRNQVFYCEQGTCSHTGGTCVPVPPYGGACACNAQTAQCIVTN